MPLLSAPRMLSAMLALASLAGTLSAQQAPVSTPRAVLTGSSIADPAIPYAISPDPLTSEFFILNNDLTLQQGSTGAGITSGCSALPGLSPLAGARSLSTDGYAAYVTAPATSGASGAFIAAYPYFTAGGKNSCNATPSLPLPGPVPTASISSAAHNHSYIAVVDSFGGAAPDSLAIFESASIPSAVGGTSIPGNTNAVVSARNRTTLDTNGVYTSVVTEDDFALLTAITERKTATSPGNLWFYTFGGFATTQELKAEKILAPGGLPLPAINSFLLHNPIRNKGNFLVLVNQDSFNASNPGSSPLDSVPFTLIDIGQLNAAFNSVNGGTFTLPNIIQIKATLPYSSMLGAVYNPVNNLIYALVAGTSTGGTSFVKLLSYDPSNPGAPNESVVADLSALPFTSGVAPQLAIDGVSATLQILISNPGVLYSVGLAGPVNVATIVTGAQLGDTNFKPTFISSNPLLGETYIASAGGSVDILARPVGASIQATLEILVNDTDTSKFATNLSVKLHSPQDIGYIAGPAITITATRDGGTPFVLATSTLPINNNDTRNIPVKYPGPGRYQLIASMPAGGSFPAATSLPSIVVVDGNGVYPTSATLTVPANSTSTSVTASVNLAGITYGPSGTIIVKDATGTEVGRTNLDGTIVTLPVSVPLTLPTGTSTLTATYSGDTQNQPSTSATASITVGPATQVTPSLTLSVPSSAAPGASVNGTITFGSSTTFTPTGNIEIDIFPNMSTTPTVILIPAAQAFVTGGKSFSFTAPTATGGATLFAFYTGDTNYNVARSSTSTLLIGATAVSTTTSLSAVATATAGTAFTTTIRLTAGTSSSTPTGNVVLTATLAGGSPTTVATLTAAQALTSGGFQVSVTLNTAGTYTLTAAYAGDTNFSASTGSIPLTVVAAKGNVTLSLYVPSNVITGTTITGTVTARASGNTNPLTGNIVVTAVPAAGGASITFCTLPAATVVTSGTTNCVYTAPAAGTYHVTAAYAGDANFNPATSIVNDIFVTTQLATTLTVNAPAQVAPTSTFIFTVALKSAQTITPTGNIIVTALGKNMGTSYNLATIPAGQAFAAGGVQTSVSIAVPDFYTITATYSGDPTFKPATGTADLTVGRAFTVLTTSLVQAGTAGTPSTFNVAISGLQQATGSILVSSTIGGVPGPQATVSLGAASSTTPFGTIASLTFLKVGTYTVQATYAGDSGNSPASSTPITLNIVNTASTLKISGAAAATLGTPYPVKIDFFALGVLVGDPDILLTATPVSGGNPIVLQVSAAASQGQANYTQNFSFTTAGTYTITAVWPGDGLNSGSSATPYNVVVSAPGSGTPSFTLLFTDPVKASQGIYISSLQTQPTTTTPLALTAYGGYTTPVTLSFAPGRVNKKIAIGLKDASTGAIITATTPVLPGTNLLLVVAIAPTIGVLNLPAFPGSLPTVLAAGLFCFSLLRSRPRSAQARKVLRLLAVVLLAVSAETLLSGCGGNGFNTTTLVLTATPINATQGAAPQTLTVIVNYDADLSD